MATYRCYQNENDTEPILYHLELKDIKHIYCNNHFSSVDSPTINTLIVMLYMGGDSMPDITTSFKINKKYYKNIKKIK